MDGLAPVGDQRVHGVEVLLRDLGEPAGRAIVELVERTQRARHDDQPAARTQPRGEGTEHAGRREVAGLRHGIDLVDRIGLRAHARGRVGKHDVHRAELGGQRRDRLTVAHVEHTALDAGDGRRLVGDGRRRGCHPVGIPAGEQHAVLWSHAGGQSFDQRATEALVGTCDESDS